jgi:hypothetical protein
MHQVRQVLPSAHRKKGSNLCRFVAGIVMNMDTIRVIVPKKKKVHGTQMLEVEEDENDEGTASAQSRQDGTASTRSRPRVQWSG